MVGLFTSVDTHRRTWSLDAIYVDSEKQNEDGVYAGFSTIQRIGTMTTALPKANRLRRNWIHTSFQ